MSALEEFENKIFESYKEVVGEKAKNKDKEIVSNGSVAHAQVVIENLFLHAKKQINIFSGQLANVYESDAILANVGEFLKKNNSKLKILLQDTEKGGKKIRENAFIKLCKEFPKGKCEIKIATEYDKKRKNHFITVDSRAYRFEPNKKEKKAIACFNDKDFTGRIDEVFKKIFSRADAEL